MEHPGMPPIVKPKIGKNILTCGGLLTGIVLIVIAVMAYLVSESGLVRVPFFSRWYEGGQLSRPVSVVPMTADRLRAKILTSMQAQFAVRPEGPCVVRIDEGELSGALADAASSAVRDRSWTAENVQISVGPDGLEGTGDIVRGPLRVHMLALFDLMVDAGIVRLKTKGLRIGDLQVPAGFAEYAYGALFSRGLGEWNMNFGAYTLSEIRMLDGYVELVIRHSA